MSWLRSIATSLMPGPAVDVPALPDFDLSRYLGHWYEIARTNTWFERGLSRAQAQYSRCDDGTLNVVNTGFDASRGRWKTARAKGVPGDRPNAFKVYFVPLFYGRYEVAWIDADYSRAFVSGGSLRYAWFLSRTPAVSSGELEEFFSRAAELGYERSSFLTDQSVLKRD